MYRRHLAGKKNKNRREDAVSTIQTAFCHNFKIILSAHSENKHIPFSKETLFF
jgi:hypothetical protein